MTQAAYAHRDAYPLIATALLAAGFVVIALRPGGAGERSTAIRTLVCLWIGQNVLLVASAMLRLDLYVEAYGLSHLRLAALIWMALVGVGLSLILARITLRRGNGWLIRANALALAATLYACAFVDFPGTVADFNAAHRLDAEQAFDLPYAMSLGSAAIPAVDRVLIDYDGPLRSELACGGGDSRRTCGNGWGIGAPGRSATNVFWTTLLLIPTRRPRRGEPSDRSARHTSHGP